MAYNTGTDPTLAELITAKFIPEKYSKDIIMHVKSKLVIADSVNTTYRDDLKKGSVVNIPLFSEGSVTEVTPGTVPTPVDGCGTPTSITVNKWRKIAHEVSDMEEVQNEPAYFSKAAESQAYSIAKDVDTALGVLFSALSSSSVYGSDGQEMSDDILLAIIQGLDEADVPDEGRCIVGDPSTWVDLLKIDKFVKSDYGSGKVVATGQMGQIYGMPFKKTNNLTAATTGNYGAIMHKDALALVIQRNPRTQLVPIKQEFRTLLITDVIYGVGEIRDTFGKSFYTHKS